MGTQQHDHLEVSLLFRFGKGKRTYSALGRLREIGPYLVQALPLSIIDIRGGDDVLLKHGAQGRPIDGVFLTFDDARDALRTWCWTFVGVNGRKRRRIAIPKLAAIIQSSK